MSSFIIKFKSGIPKYRQIITNLSLCIERGSLTKGEWLPSITELSLQLDVSRDTVEKAYAELRKAGLIESAPNLGHFISKTHNKISKKKVLLLLNKLSEYKKNIYNALLQNLNTDYQVDLIVYGKDLTIFDLSIESWKINYEVFVCLNSFDDAAILQLFPKDQLIVLDKPVYTWSPDTYCAVVQDYEEDLFDALFLLSKEIKKFSEIHLIFPENHLNFKPVYQALRKYSINEGLKYTVDKTLAYETVLSGKVFLLINEEDLIFLLDTCTDKNLIPGKDIGIISYNESLLKQVIAGGITVISTDFEKMGILCAENCKSLRYGLHKVPFKVTKRSSL